MTACTSPTPDTRRTNRPDLQEVRTSIGTHGSFLAAMLDRIASGRPAALSGLHVGATDDAATALCDAWAAIADVLTFYQERIANEAYLRTAVERRSIAEIARLVGYRIRPGVAASVHLAFTLEAGAVTTVPAGTLAQSVPQGDAPARRFQTEEAVDARAIWNQLPIHTTRCLPADISLPVLYAAGVTPPVRPGEAMVLATQDRQMLRRVTEVAREFGGDRTRICLAPSASALAPGLTQALAQAVSPQGQTISGVAADRLREPSPALADTVDSSMASVADDILGDISAPANAASPARRAARRVDSLSALLAPEGDLAMRLRGMSIPNGDGNTLFSALRALPTLPAHSVAAYAMRLRTAPSATGAPPRLKDGHLAAEDWPLSEAADILFLEAVAPDIMPGSWVAFELPPGQEPPPPRRVLAASIVTRVAYGVAARCTRLLLDGPWLDPATAAFAHLRELTVYADSAPVLLAEEDIAEPVGGREIELAGIVGELAPGRWLMVEGELAGRPGARVGEAAMLAGLTHCLPRDGNAARSRLTLTADLAYRYRRDTVTVWGNVARATEGEAVTEVLGSGDGTFAGQAFALSRAPLTYVSAPTETGSASTLKIVVNGLEWREIDNLFLAGPRDRVFVIEPAGVAPLRIRFGDGVTGARLPSGTDNVVARYRVGMGAGGNADAGTISQLLSRPAGLRSVINPRAASGGADPERRDDARRNTAVGVTSLHRLVGVQDYTDFASGFAGVGKANAVLLRQRMGTAVLVTVAGQDESQIGPDSDLLSSLADALEYWGDPAQQVLVLPARNLRIALAARVRMEAGYVWDWVAPRLRAHLLDRFGYPRRGLGQWLRQSQILAAMHEAEGIAEVALEVLAALPDPVTTDVLHYVAATREAGDVRVRPGRLAAIGGGREPRPAEIGFLSQEVPELVVLTEMAG